MDLIERIIAKESGVPASPESIRLEEIKLGFPFPPDLKKIYLTVANGGIGPGYKLLGVKGGHTSDEGDSIAELYTLLNSADPEDPELKWPEGLIPFCHWGCAIYSCFDATKEEFPVVWYDPNMRESGEPVELMFSPHKNAFVDWLASWLDGKDLWGDRYTS
ncbi:SMI1/KNR4 family protein [Pokkaliibacter plantistimulans]|uniref:SMI1/KNR4 family protein n=1 Tax=Proteobacteria bacterium 228 TaxID=2083153 RepID=A0A2S5KKF8_9PROT|nr:SMI1/KNR4 family protein [Pokkaliibacter plantistimulans]PPC75220.1 SMI1/KNR4 family protein [Pokkaliibacter plantistimulans]